MNPHTEGVSKKAQMTQAMIVAVQDRDGHLSVLCPYTLSRFAGLPWWGFMSLDFSGHRFLTNPVPFYHLKKREIGGTGYCVTYDTDSQSVTALASPLGRGPRSGEGMYEGKNDYDTR